MRKLHQKVTYGFQKPISIEIVEPAKYSDEDILEFTESLWQVHSNVFKNIDRVTFVNYVLFPEAKLTRIHVFRKRGGEIIGFFSIHHFEKEFEGKRVTVLRGEIGVLPEYRRQHYVIKEIIKAGLLNRLRYGFKEVWVLGCFISPAMYSLMANMAFRVYPNYRYIIPDRIRQLMLQLADKFDLPESDKNTPLVRNIGWISRQAIESEVEFSESRNEDVQFYLNQNPQYTRGYGLEIFIPLSFINMLLSTFNMALGELGISRRIYARY